MNSGHRWVYPKIGRAGLGNELFPLLRALDEAESRDIELIPPRWGQIRIGPTLRGERDRRQYWKLFRRPSIRQRFTRLLLTIASPRGLVVVTGMQNYFDDLRRPAEWYRARLEGMTRPNTIRARDSGAYVSVHVRLGDFARAPDSQFAVLANNTSTSIDWYVQMVRSLLESRPGIAVVVSSDGTESELAPLCSIPGVQRSDASNALDEMYLMAGSIGIIGSRSTFTAWGAFLGDVPLLVAPGGDAYRPHARVWEAETPLDASGWLVSLRAIAE